MADTGQDVPNLAKIIAALQRLFAPVALVPFQLRTPPVNGQLMGIGKVFTVSTAQATPITLTHGLGRTPVMAMVLDNGATAQTLLVVSARSSTTITIAPVSAALSGALVWIV